MSQAPSMQGVRWRHTLSVALFRHVIFIQAAFWIGKMAAAAVVEFQRAQSLISTDRNASIDILHSIGKCLAELWCRILSVKSETLAASFSVVELKGLTC